MSYFTAEVASIAHLTPRSPSERGKLALIHYYSVNSALSTSNRPRLRVLSKTINSGLLKHGDVLSIPV